jgi:hypothetical protein
MKVSSGERQILSIAISLGATCQEKPLRLGCGPTESVFLCCRYTKDAEFAEIASFMRMLEVKAAGHYGVAHATSLLPWVPVD